MDRLDKILVSQNIGSRKEVQKLIRKKAVVVDGETITKPEFKVDTDKSSISVMGQALDFKRYIYIMMNKPQGVVSATEDRNDKTVIDLVPEHLYRKGLFPAGRLDKDTEGLLIITDDGDFAHRMLSPKNRIYKRYYVEVDGEIREDMIESFEKGLVFADGTQCLPAKLEIDGKNSGFVEICEGKFHQVKKMFQIFNLKVTFLKRISIGLLKLDGNLPIGECRELEKTEQNAIFVVK